MLPNVPGKKTTFPPKSHKIFKVFILPNILFFKPCSCEFVRIVSIHTAMPGGNSAEEEEDEAGQQEEDKDQDPDSQRERPEPAQRGKLRVFSVLAENTNISTF